jgi:hypothetical protein
VVLNVTTSWKESSREMKHGSIITSQRVNFRVWNGHILVCPPRKSSNASNCRKAYADSFFGTHKGYCWNIIKRGVQQ